MTVDVALAATSDKMLTVNNLPLSTFIERMSYGKDHFINTGAGQALHIKKKFINLLPTLQFTNTHYNRVVSDLKKLLKES